MYCRDRNAASYPVGARVSPLRVVALLLCFSPALAGAQALPVQQQADTPPVISNPNELPPLTVAQEKARQLATILTGKSAAPHTTAIKTPLSLIAEHTMRLGRRMLIPLFATRTVEGRLVGGLQTFASPGDNVAATVRDDAKRPLFLPAAQAALALEVGVK